MYNNFYMVQLGMKFKKCPKIHTLDEECIFENGYFTVD